MSLGDHLFHARKKAGLSQEAAAEKLNVSRQTISKWDTGETLPDVLQAKRLATLYGLTLDDLIAFDADVKEWQEVIDKTPDEAVAKVDWTKVWAKKYPVLGAYQQQVDAAPYAAALQALLRRLQKEHGYSDQDACLVLKDILAHSWRMRR